MSFSQHESQATLQGSPRFSAAFNRRTLLAIAGLLLTAFVVTAISLVHIALDQDRQAREQSLFFASKALEARKQNIARTIGDYAFWGDAYQHLHTQVDLEWAYTRQNMGPSLYENFAYDGLFVVAPDGKTVYAVIEGKLQTLEARQWLQGDVAALLARARAAAQDEQPLVEIMWVGQRPALVAAAGFTTGSDPQIATIPGAPSVLLFVDVLSAEKLHEYGQDYALANLRIPTDTADAATPTLSQPSAAGAPLLLRWDQAQPGRDLLSVVLPLLALVGLVLAVLTWLVLRNAMATARLMDLNYNRLTNSRTALAASEERFRDVAEAASDWLWEIDAEHRLTYLSERFEAVTGHPPSAWLGRSLDQLLSGDGQPLLDWLQSRQGQSDDRAPLHCRYLARDGRQHICRIAARPILKETPSLGGYRGTASDITEEVEAQARIQHLSQHDSLTGLPNRNRLREFLEGKLSTLPSIDQPLVMLSIDLDRFKPINDALGHAAGDRVLHEVSQRLRQCTRDEDLVARHGGDEFIMVLSGIYAQQDVEHLCARLIEKIEQPYRLEDQEVFIGASIGIAMAPHDASQVDELLRYADIALYQAKAGGRGTWRFYASEMNERIVERRRLEQDLRLALGRDDQLCLHFQPRYRLDGLRLAGVEALVRWQHPQRDLLGPERFIALAEETGLIAPLGAWVLRSACREAMRWPQPLLVSVNLSPLQFRRSDLVAQVKAALDESGLPAARLELEITESVMLEDAEGALVTLKQLKALGLRLSMDDFGTGYSSLNYLRAYPFDALKIDRSFIAGLDGSADSRAIVQAIIGLGHALSMTVTAEGVENQQQLSLLQRDGCHEAQGFYLSQPLPVEQLRALLRREVDA
ncbi:EAL domain-containing protein [Pseudomonas sp. 2FE]|uniref:bifunctional diguanylate cyclase/phosphodiesterase n=1 Tax=Pseudomonas sp. 2FE TaxID=2502190 RepID=UPI0010F565C6|nr:EAL domain-containing protein [Pseudomonas sp. 2FE]